MPEDVTADLRAENAAIRSRLARLEEILLSGSSTVLSEAQSSYDTSPLTAESLRPVVTGVATEVSNKRQEDVNSYEADLQSLGGVGTAGDTKVPYLSYSFRTCIVSLDDIDHQSLNLPHDASAIPLLEESTTMDVFDFYAKRLDPGAHVLYLPSVRSSLQRLFQDVTSGVEMDPSHTALLLSIYTTVAVYWAYSEREEILFFRTGQQAKALAFCWLRRALDVLEHARRSGTATLETIQATILVMFLLYRLDGLSPRARALHASAIVLARDLGLHYIDSRRHDSKKDTQDVLIDREIKRRVWWHLAATDWSLSMAGPHNGTYSIHPKQMKVRKPRNISDEELATQSEDFEHPISTPTVMTYYLQRIRLGEVSQRVADLSFSTVPDEMTIKEIWQVEHEFTDILADAPGILQLDKNGLPNALDLGEPDKSFALQRYIFNITLHARRCKFHGPFVLRAAHDPQYVPFRTACLQAARSIVQAYKGLSNDQSFLYVANSRLNDVIHHFFYATVVLVMDFCIYRGACKEASSKAEIRDACKVLEAAKSQPGAASIFLDSLMSVLEKHRVRLQEQEQATKAGHDGVEMLAPRGSQQHDTRMPVLPGADSEPSLGELDFDDLWQSFIDLESIDVQSWDALMNDIDVMH